jgi:hypothetical protein
VKAELQIVHPHERATSKPRQEGYDAEENQAINLKISSTEQMRGGIALHTECKARATRRDNQAGVS